MQSCSLPVQSTEVIRLGHGSGGRLTQQLIENHFLPWLGNDTLNEQDDAALLNLDGSAVAISTDSYVVKPLFFPGGTIGSLSVHGTVNDLAMRAAAPHAITAGFILEEGFPVDQLAEIVRSFYEACQRCDITVVAADTKVVERGSGDGIFINTTGIGTVVADHPPSARRAEPGDKILVNGPVGLHGMAILSQREDLGLESEIVSDSAPVHELALAMIRSGQVIHTMRDLTRGGLSSALNEIAASSRVGIQLDEREIPVDPLVQSSCELLGLDPLYVACEGRFITIAPEGEADRLLELCSSREDGAGMKAIGRVTDLHPLQVVLKSKIGGSRVLDKLSGDQLPRIC